MELKYRKKTTGNKEENQDQMTKQVHKTQEPEPAATEFPICL